jgi:hypothetical protein
LTVLIHYERKSKTERKHDKSTPKGNLDNHGYRVLLAKDLAVWTLRGKQAGRETNRLGRQKALSHPVSK